MSGERDTRLQDEADFRNNTFVNLLEERLGIEEGVTNGSRVDEWRVAVSLRGGVKGDISLGE